jgi:hypothetical protein
MKDMGESGCNWELDPEFRELFISHRTNVRHLHSGVFPGTILYIDLDYRLVSGLRHDVMPQLWSGFWLFCCCPRHRGTTNPLIKYRVKKIRQAALGRETTTYHLLIPPG